MVRLAVRQIRMRPWRAVALFAAIVFATTGFTVLTGTTTTARARTTGTVDRNYRAAYDILVRPTGARTELERQRGLVRPNYLSGLYGGLTLDQYEQVRSTLGVQVAAPVAMVGYVLAWSQGEVDVTDAVDRSLTRQVLRARPTWRADRGLSTRTDDSPVHVYVTRNELAWPTDQPGRYTDGRDHSAAVLATCGADLSRHAVEIGADGSATSVCREVGGSGARPALVVAHLRADGDFDLGGNQFGGPTTRRLTVWKPWPMALMLAAIDPVEEDKLVGLGGALVSGRNLDAADGTVRPLPGHPNIPTVGVLATSRPYLDEQLTMDVERLGSDAASMLGGTPAGALDARLSATAGRSLFRHSENAEDAYGRQVRGGLHANTYVIVRGGPPVYETAPDGSLRPTSRPADAGIWAPVVHRHGSVPRFAADDATRPVSAQQRHQTGATDQPAALAVGTFDPQRLVGFSELATVPLETYHPPRATGADQRSRDLLGDQPLRPNSNPAGYLATPPLMLATLGALPALLEPGSPIAAAPISAVRVRVDGVTGVDALSQERIRLVAEDIARRAGADVDITIGSSPAPQTVTLPGGRFGRPDLSLVEGWSHKGVAMSIIRAVDQRSVALYALVLAVCALFLVNAVSAAVRERRRELAILSCLGWPRRRLAGLILVEVLLLGGAGGVLSMLAAVPVARLTGVDIDYRHALLAVPVAVVLALVAAVVPAVRASRAHPAAAVHPAASARGGRARVRGLFGLSVNNLARTPGRTSLAAGGLTVATFGFTMITAINGAFQGRVVGSLLGEVVSVQVRAVDLIAMSVTAVLAVASVTDVLYLGVRERAGQFAVLRACGWSEAQVGRLVLGEGLLLGVLGTVPGAALALALLAALGTGVTGEIWGAALGTVGLGVLLTAVVAAMAPLVLRRLPLAQLIAEE
ncbi:ABC transporter permease [Longispora urticae]